VAAGEAAVKVSNAKAAEHRATLIAAARRLLQEQGFDGAGVEEISREAGLTQGALYGQFKSKGALTAEAARAAIAAGLAAWERIAETAPDRLRAYLDAYLCTEHWGDVGGGCLLAACVSEVRRQDAAIGDVFEEGFRRQVELIQGALPTDLPAAEARRRALALLSAMIGSVAMARAIAGTDPELAKEITAAARAELEDLARRACPGNPIGSDSP
jgi:TetR/AcrR family transcriptional repressor of nem operon